MSAPISTAETPVETVDLERAVRDGLRGPVTARRTDGTDVRLRVGHRRVRTEDGVGVPVADGWTRRLGIARTGTVVRPQLATDPRPLATARFAVGPQGWALALDLLVSALAYAAGTAAPLLALLAATGGPDRWWYAAGSVAALLAALACGTLADRLSTDAQSQVHARVEKAVWQRVLALPPTFFRSVPLRRVIGYATAVGSVRALLGAVGVDVAVGALAGALCTAGLAVLDLRLGALGLAAVLLVLAVVAVLARRQQHHDAAVFDGVDDVQAVLYPALRGIEEIHSYGAQDFVRDRWQRAFDRQKAADEAGLRHAEVADALLASVQPILLAVLLPAALAWTPGPVAVVVVVVLAVQLGASLAALSASIPALFSIGLAYRRLRPILQTAPEVDATRAVRHDLGGDVRLCAVSARYPDATDEVLRGVDLTAHPGECVAVVGGSGSGKSTLLRVLLGLVPATAGAVLYDGQPLDRLDPDHLRRQVGYVAQDGRLLRGTVRQVVLGEDDPDEQRTDQAWDGLEAAGVAEDVRAMPMGLDTRVADGDAGFSGGQVQRLLLARALARSPRLLLLDEATSALDESTQRHVVDAVGRLGVTRIVVAHRLSTIRGADRVVVLRDGRVVETGSYAELVAQPGELSRLLGGAPARPRRRPAHLAPDPDAPDPAPSDPVPSDPDPSTEAARHRHRPGRTR